MENASKALIMAGTILISIMVISLGVYIINMFGEYTARQEQERADKKIAEFNAQFLKYEGRDDITAQDIVTVANLAKANNDFYEFNPSDENAKADENTYYIQVNVNFVTGFVNNLEKIDKKEEYLEKESNIITENLLGEKVIKTYKCNSVKVSSVTHRVYEITFTK